MNESTYTRWLPPPDPSGPVTCETCGCRLTELAGFDGGAWRHFPSLHAGQDARGCRPHCIDRIHGRDGRPSEMLDQVALLVRERTDASFDGAFRGSASSGREEDVAAA
jgi:hypothetical protein